VLRPDHHEIDGTEAAIKALPSSPETRIALSVMRATVDLEMGPDDALAPFPALVLAWEAVRPSLTGQIADDLDELLAMADRPIRETWIGAGFRRAT